MTDLKTLLPELNENQRKQLIRLIEENVIDLKDGTMWASDAYWRGRHDLQIEQRAQLRQLINGDK